jgi:hypothetical protein
MKKLRFSGRAAIVCSLILAIGVPSVAMGFGEGRNMLLGKRNPSSNPSLALSTETEIIANNSTYGTRQSNKKDGDGGGAIYGCRSSLGNEPCVKAVNLKGGHAFEFNTVGLQAGRIETGNPTGAPFTTNATGVATGLNADKVDGKDATDFAPAADVTALKAAVDGSLLSASVADPGAGDSTLTVTGRGATAASENGDTYTVTFNKDVSKCTPTVSAIGATPQLLSVAAGGSNTQVNVNKLAADQDTSFNVNVIC